MDGLNPTLEGPTSRYIQRNATQCEVAGDWFTAFLYSRFFAYSDYCLTIGQVGFQLGILYSVEPCITLVTVSVVLVTTQTALVFTFHHRVIAFVEAKTFWVLCLCLALTLIVDDEINT